MAASLDNSTNTGGDTFANSKSVTAPAGAAAGKIVILTVEHWTSGAEPTVTNWAALGFTEITGAHATMVTTSSPGNQSIRKAWKRLTAADTSWNVTFSATCWNAAQAELWSGLLASGDPVDAANTATASTGYPNAAVTVTDADAISNSAGTTQAVTTTPPTGYTERQDQVTLHTNTQVASGAGTINGTGGTVSGNGEICVATVALKPASSGSNFTLTPTDAEGLTDSQAYSLGKVVGPDAVALSDSAAILQDKAAADALGLTDTATVALAADRAATDNLPLTDSALAERTLGQTVTDPLGLSDTAVVAAGRQVAAGDTENLTDTAAMAVGKTVTDSLGVTDQVTTDRAQAASDDAGLTDSVSVQLTSAGTVSATDNLGLTDTAQVVSTRAQAATDTIGLSDQIAFAVTRDLGDTITVTDAADITVAFAKVVADSEQVTDTARLDRATQTVDLLGLTDSVTVVLSSTTEPVFGRLVASVSQSLAGTATGSILTATTEPTSRLEATNDV